MRAPTDAALPRFALLLDPDAMTPVLERSLGRAARVEQVRIARVAYKPGDRANVHYEALVDGRVEDAVTWAVAGRDLSARARQPALLELARRVDGRSPAVRPLVYEPDADALVTWLPLDPRLPALVRLPSAPVVRVAESYKPGVRIVLRSGRRVLKAYGKDRAFELGVDGLRLAAASPLRAPRLEAAYPRLRLTAQTAVEGTVPTPESAAQAAGALVRRLQAAPLAPARVRRAETVLALAAEKARLAALVLPALGTRLTRLLDGLRKSAPPGEALVPAHGDFDADQLVDADDGELVVLDFDDVCLAPAAFDLATYLADVARGREQDAAAIEAVRAPLLAGYGARPAALEWYLAAVILTRAPHAFQRGLSDWPERVDGMVRTAEEVLAG
jgi:Phosphotransferase enzyme family